MVSKQTLSVRLAVGTNKALKANLGISIIGFIWIELIVAETEN